MNWFVLASSSAILSAAAAIIQKKVLSRLTALEFSFLVSVVILLFSSFVPFSTNVTSIPPSTLMIIVGKSILGGIAFLFVMMSLEHNPISTALPILGMTPGVTAIAALLVLGETLHDLEWVGLGLMMIGTYILESRPSQNIFRPFKEILQSKNYYYMYGALGLFAVSSVLDKLLVSGYKIDILIVLFYQHIVYCLMFGLLIFIRKLSFRDLMHKGRNQFPFILIVALLTFAYRFTQLGATQLAPVALEIGRAHV
jgi:uncharacterized membrane protein